MHFSVWSLRQLDNFSVGTASVKKDKIRKGLKSLIFANLSTNSWPRSHPTIANIWGKNQVFFKSWLENSPIFKPILAALHCRWKKHIFFTEFWGRPRHGKKRCFLTFLTMAIKTLESWINWKVLHNTYLLGEHNWHVWSLVWRGSSPSWCFLATVLSEHRVPQPLANIRQGIYNKYA